MTSSRASSVTLADESIHDDLDVPMDIDSEDEEFRLPDEYFDPYDPRDLSPSMKAARESDPRHLKAVLEIGKNEGLSDDLGFMDALGNYGENVSRAQIARQSDIVPRPDASEFGVNSTRWECLSTSVGITTPLMEAIRSRLPRNVEILLNAKADPNGIPTEISDWYAAFFLRFRSSVPPRYLEDVASRKELLSLMDLPQTTALTREEAEDRFYEGVAPFWCEEGFVEADHYKNGESMPSLVEAARSGSIEIFDLLVATGADWSFWCTQCWIPVHDTPSSLSVSSPIHAALQVRDHDMLQHLLGKGFNPNTMPLANPTRCFTPLMATIIYSSNFNQLAFDTLADHHLIDFELRTPVYNVHILHFAVATLNLDLLEHVSARTPLHNAGETALGHTLLHIACMPANASQIERHSEIIYKSIHETRDLHAENDPHAPHPENICLETQDGIAFMREEHRQQTEMVMYLWDQGIQNIHVQDVHGNTALHYLSGCKHINFHLIEWLQGKQDVLTIWEEADNRYGVSAQGLAYAGLAVKKTFDPDGEMRWKPWFESSWKVGRVERKNRIWRRMLGDDVGTRKWFAEIQDAM